MCGFALVPNATLQVSFDQRDAHQSLDAALAAFLLARGLYATLMWPVTGVYETASSYKWNRTLLEHDFGAPLAGAREEPTGVFTRRYENGAATLDCNALKVHLNLGAEPERSGTHA